ncbi:hypothetical protein C8Q80DRAFT_272058 [Daedaleopsis nitida]|nr:hypothetical protein C8Q80DRAFT_272058 [Daedaleopsis nitida]
MLRTPPKLNLDILRTVLEHAERGTQLTLMRTCHAFYQDGAKQVLSEPAWIDWRDEVGIASFLDFVRAEDGRRWPLLTGLIIGSGWIRSQLAEPLVEGIRQWSNIEYLELRHVDDFLSSHPDLVTALSTLRNVKHLKVTHAAKCCCELLERAEWQLVTAELSFATEGVGDWSMADILPRMHPAALLRSSRTSLVKLRCQFWEPASDEWNPALPVYPNVRKLEMSGIWYPATRQWVESYPNLRNLHVFATPTDQSSIHDVEHSEFRGTHERNRVALVGRCWDNLDVVSASWAELYLLGLTCRVRHLRTSGPSWSFAYLAEALEYTRPACLDIDMHGRDMSSCFPRLEDAAASLQDVEELQIKLRFHGDDSQRDIARDVVSANRCRYYTCFDPRMFLQNLAMSVLRVFAKLRVFALHIDCNIMRINFFKDPAPLTPAERSLQKLDRRALFQTVTETAPIIAAFEFEMQGVQDMGWVREKFERQIVNA